MNLYSLENTEKIYFNFGIGIPLTGGFAVQTRNSNFFNGISLFSFSTKGVMISFPIDLIINLTKGLSKNKFVLIHQFGNIITILCSTFSTIL